MSSERLPQYSRRTPTKTEEIKRIETALECISPEPRKEWVEVGMALHSWDDGKGGLDLWERWSAGASSFKPGECASKWRGFKPGKITLATLFHLAQESGGSPIRRIHHQAPTRPVESFQKVEEKICGWNPPGDPVAIYYYNAPENGNPIYRKVRYKTSTGKITPFQRYDASRDAWIGGSGCMEGVRRVLYRGEQFSGFQRVFITEGEKSADLLWDLGILAVCSDSGAQHWRPAFSRWLTGKDVGVLPDNDEPGQAHAEAVAASLHGVARSVRVIELPGLGPKADVYDWLTMNAEAL